MIFRRSALRELTGLAFAVFFVLLAITVTTLLIRYLGQAATGALAPEAVIAMVAFRILDYLAIMLTLTLFISVLLTLTRSYRDSEMVVWFSSGLSLAAWIPPVLTFALPLALVIAVLSLGLSPWAVNRANEYQHQLESRDEVSSVAPGVFRESHQADRVYFVEKYSPSLSSVRNVFVHSVQHQRVGAMVAREGFQEESENGDRFLVLVDGRRYEGTPGSRDYRILDFKRYAMRIEAYEALRKQPSVKSLSSLELAETPTPERLAELSWRVGLPLLAVILALLAIPLSFVNPRAGRSLNLIFALLVYGVYNNAMSIAKAWVAQEKLTPMAGFLGVHAAMLLLLMVLFYHRLALFSLFRLRRR